MFFKPCFPPPGRFSFIFQSQRKSRHNCVFLQEKRLLCLRSPAQFCEVPAGGGWAQEGDSDMGGSSPRAGVILLFVAFRLQVPENQLGSLLKMWISWPGGWPGDLHFKRYLGDCDTGGP